jgi:hypothetical protein
MVKSRFLLSGFLLSDQVMCLSFNKKPVEYGRFSVLEGTFQGQKHGCKDFGIVVARNKPGSRNLSK